VPPLVEPSGHRDGAFTLLRGERGLLLVRNNRLRAGTPTPTWDLPGGAARPGEPLPVALAREVREETGLAVVDPRLVLVVDGAKRRGAEAPALYTWRAFVFEARTSGEPRLGAGITDAAWVDAAGAVRQLEAPWHAPTRARLAGSTDAYARVEWIEPSDGAHAESDLRAALGALAAAGATGARDLVARSVALARSLGAEPHVLREVLLMLVPYAGFPRALAALHAARLAPATDDAEAAAGQRDALGRLAFEGVYGETAERVLAGLHALDPRLPAWTLEHAYGRVLARPGLPLLERELLAVSLLTGLGGLDDPLLGHMRGARRLGASAADVAAMVDAVPLELGEGRRLAARALLSRLTP
jgi:4-carboxymuconolactone decarboxylase